MNFASKSLESDKVEKYVDGLPDMIHGSVMATKPKTMQHAIEFTTELMDKKISTLAERQAEKQEENLITTNKNSNNNFQEGRSGSSLRRWEWGKGRTYGLGSSLCNKCKFHPPIARALFKNRTLTCYECGNQGHSGSDFPELRIKNHETKRRYEARGMYIRLEGQSAINLAHQKSYADVRQKPIEFQVDKPGYASGIALERRVESVAYKLKLPQELSRVHNTFHVSNLRKCYADEPLAVPLGGLHLDNEL
ncbi:hypothetical protein Tco_0743476 [Tanacetum coccineum]